MNLTAYLRVSSSHFVVIIKLDSLFKTNNVTKMKLPYKPEAFSPVSLSYSFFKVYKIDNSDKPLS